MKPSRVFAAFSLVFTAATAANAQKISRQPYSPAFNADATKIVYVDKVTTDQKKGEGLREIWVVNADGSGAHRLLTGIEDYDPQWSQDGKTIAFQRSGDIWTIGADGKGLKNLTASEHKLEFEAHWTTDGKSLVYLCDELAQIGGKWHETGARVMLRDLATGKTRQVLDTDFNVEEIALTPERDDLVYLRSNAVNEKGEAVDNDEYDPAITALNLSNGKMRTVYSIDKKIYGDRTLQSIRRGKDFFLVHASDADFKTDDIAILKGGKLSFLPRLYDLGSLTPDGTKMVVSGILDSTREWGLAVHDLEARKVVLDIKTGLADPAQREANDHLIKGKALANAYKYLDAIAEFSEAVKQDPKLVDAWYQRGLSYGEAGNFKAAIADFDKTIELNNVHANAHLHRGALYQKLGDDDKARSDYGAAAIFFDDPGKKAFALRKRAEMLRKAGMGDMADAAEKQAGEYEAKAGK